MCVLADSLSLLEDHGHGHHGANPHFYLDPVHAAASARNIAAVLSDAAPAAAPRIRARLALWLDTLRALDSTIVQSTRGWSSRRFVADHAAWDYFARRYGLEQTGVIEAVPGREISARALGDLVRAMRRDRTRAVFTEAMRPVKAAEMLAAEAGARVALLFVSACPPGGGYTDMMRANLREMERVLR
jgi:ABC-type Zn uptake system ZnuABC Zn-binding protein ZnuA